MPRACPHGYIWNVVSGAPDECGCICQPTICPENYFWDLPRCACIPDPLECGPNMYWDNVHEHCRCNPDDCSSFDQPSFFDDHDCVCKCGDPGNCSAFDPIDNPNSLARFWDYDLCQCVCEFQSCSDLGKHYKWDNLKCRCQCTECDCPIGQFFDKSICECVCQAQECEAGSYWNSEQCACLCLEPELGCVSQFGANFFWDISSCRCQCEYQTPTQDDQFFDMTDCQMKKKP
jgi:hypothetical protein